MNRQLRAGDFIVAARQCAFVVQVRARELLIVPVVSAKLGRHRSDVEITGSDPRMPIVRPALRCKSARLIPNEDQEPIAGLQAPEMAPRVLLGIRTEALAQENETRNTLGNWHREAAMEVSAVR